MAVPLWCISPICDTSFHSACHIICTCQLPLFHMRCAAATIGYAAIFVSLGQLCLKICLVRLWQLSHSHNFNFSPLLHVCSKEEINNDSNEINNLITLGLGSVGGAHHWEIWPIIALPAMRHMTLHECVTLYL